MTDTGSALLRSIFDNPAEDTPRLVYADWLEENNGYDGFERAQVIRKMIAAPKDSVLNLHMGSALGWDHYWENGKLCYDWFADGATLSDHPFPRRVEIKPQDHPHSNAYKLVWERGFVSEVCLDKISYNNRVTELFAAHPVERIHVYHVFPYQVITGHAGTNTNTNTYLVFQGRSPYASAYSVSRVVFKLLKGRPDWYTADTRYRVKVYDRYVTAYDDLQAALLENGKRTRTR